MQETQKWQNSQQTDTLTSQLTAHYPGIWPRNLLAIPKFTMYFTSSFPLLKAPFSQWLGMEEHSAPLLASGVLSWLQNSSYQIRIWRCICNTLYLLRSCTSSVLEVKSIGRWARSKFNTNFLFICHVSLWVLDQLNLSFWSKQYKVLPELWSQTIIFCELDKTRGLWQRWHFIIMVVNHWFTLSSLHVELSCSVQPTPGRTECSNSKTKAFSSQYVPTLPHTSPPQGFSAPFPLGCLPEHQHFYHTGTRGLHSSGSHKMKSRLRRGSG